MSRNRTSRPAKPFDYLICVNRWPARKRFEIYPCRLRDPLPVIDIPLADPDPDVPLAIQTALEQVYDEGDYMLRVRYDQPCVPSPLTRGPGVGLRALVGLPPRTSGIIPGRERPLSHGIAASPAPTADSRCSHARPPRVPK